MNEGGGIGNAECGLWRPALGLGHHFDGFGVEAVFLDLDAGVEGGGGVGGKEGDAGLGDDGAGVHAVVDEVDGAAALGGTVGDGLFPGVEAGVGGEEGGGDVEDAPGEGVEEGAFDEAHETGEADDFGPGGLEGGGGFLLGRGGEFLGEAAAVDEGGGEVGVPGALKDEGVRVVGEDEDDFRVEAALADGVENGLHVGTGAGTENAEAEHGGE